MNYSKRGKYMRCWKTPVLLLALGWGLSAAPELPRSQAFAAEIDAGCRDLESCYKVSRQRMRNGEWAFAELSLKKTQKILLPYRDVEVEALLAIAQTHALRSEKPSMQEIYLGSPTKFCPNHDTCMAVAQKAMDSGAYGTALVNFKRALFRNPRSKRATDGIWAACRALYPPQNP